MKLYQGYDRAELCHQYNARATVTGEYLAAILAQYSSRSADMRARLRCFCDIAYGPHADEVLDIFPAENGNGPVLVFIHGGYWRALSKDDSSFMAETFTRAGATVVAVNYSLAPSASLEKIIDQNRRAAAWIHRHIARYGADPERIYLCGSSAGGHLAGMLLADDWQEVYGAPKNIVAGACCISGLYDLTPISHTHINDWIKLDSVSAHRCSPQFHLPASSIPLLISYGEFETDEFKRQSDCYLHAWRDRGFAAGYVAMPGTNHFDVVLKLMDRDSPLTRSLLEMMGL
ncbi:alpha/beta hydrolase [Verminephrobacter eiseniae]|uniref:alpha/beta hydrolase n=1 Tax=Verminephrobacter eiseniae TaxID=364317 RepID=UPI002236F05F|nr:alpha/beta hydrolase [Verminephrobacter eiseniae]MCW5233244.1 alpha/beta hydrolase [Verminephrobacter eiseniae]MCW5295202.1 alpha/beta hydrolase [Verminephrobacter eiseniae]MCW8184146.1 alpha/beta hydrolase [Verminephrobacter eiseniae]MCW8222681.1 alpha/beta hydrolase [Verminephrobacter eiseniae]MCW8234151.1 alpha/beta hydrolase [Verminephrobacter eiseniae]